MQNNNLPKNMGKKIADALKQQNLSDENQDILDLDSELNEEISYQETNESLDTAFGLEEETQEDNFTSTFNVAEEDRQNPDLKLSIDGEEEEAEEFEMPNNINVLKRLIGQLPTGVPRQTGAQIIRQTIEALGIPMKSVLQDAQRVRDCLNSSIKDCNYTIQEYKTNIRNLEKQTQNYQKQLNKLNDIIGLFVYNDRK